MKTLKTVRLFYLLYTVYTVFVMLVSDYHPEDALWGLIIIWGVFAVFYCGFISVRRDAPAVVEPETIRDSRFPFSKIADWHPLLYFANMAICMVCSVLVTRFYTRMGFTEVIGSLFTKSSNYADYQRYFRHSSISTFSIAKIPYILMLTFMTAMLFWGIIGILMSGKKIRAAQIVYIIGVSAAYLYFGVARGTNFEMYIVFTLIVFCLLGRGSGKEKNSGKLNIMAIVVCVILGFIIIAIFRNVVEARGSEFKNVICTEITYDPNKLFSQLFPTLTNIGLSVFSYLGFGIFAIGRTCVHTLQSGPETAASMLPNGYGLLMEKSLTDMSYDRIDIEVRWVPDYMKMIELLGLPLMLSVVFLMGRIVAKNLTRRRTKLLSDLINFVIFLEMISVPVGNFIMTSTPNVLVVIAILAWAVKDYFVGEQPESDIKCVKSTQSRKLS